MPKRKAKVRQWKGWGVFSSIDGSPHIKPLTWARREVANWCQCSLAQVVRVLVRSVAGKKGKRRCR